MEEELKRVECLIERCNQCKLNACITCDICWSEVQAIKEILEQNKEIGEENKKLKDNYKNQIEHTTILAKALKLEEDALIDEIYAEINKLKTNSIPISVIEKKIGEVNNSNGYSPVNKIFIEKVLNEILEEGRK